MERLRLVAGAILHAFCASSGKADPDEVHRWVQLLPLGSKGMLRWRARGPRSSHPLKRPTGAGVHDQDRTKISSMYHLFDHVLHRFLVPKMNGRSKLAQVAT